MKKISKKLLGVMLFAFALINYVPQMGVNAEELTNEKIKTINLTIAAPKIGDEVKAVTKESYGVEYQVPDKAGILRNYGISERSYKDAIRGLKDKSYLEGTGKNMIFHIYPKPIEYNLEDIIANISEKQKVKLYNEIKPKDKYIVIK